MKLAHAPVAAIAAALISGGASAATISYGTSPSATSTLTTGLTINNFTTILSTPRFNATLGTLNSVGLSFAGTIGANFAFENLDPFPNIITASARSTVSLTRPDGTTLAIASATASRTQAETAYDGTTDFAGSSGDTFLDVSSSATAPFVLLTSAGDLALFTGASNLSLVVTSIASSSVTGAGNVASQASTRSAGSLFVTYTYNAARTSLVPEPASWAMMIAGFGLVGAAMRRRKVAVGFA